jgi:hypothetical protein
MLARQNAGAAKSEEEGAQTVGRHQDWEFEEKERNLLHSNKQTFLALLFSCAAECRGYSVSRHKEANGRLRITNHEERAK